MIRIMCKSKIHRATVTRTELHYPGSITIDGSLMKDADLLPFEQVHVLNVNNGQRAETYCIPGRRGSGEICLNGPTARLAQPGDLIIILAYGWVTPAESRTLKPRIVHVDGRNRVVRGPAPGLRSR